MPMVRAPNGQVINFPDGTPPATINSVMSSYHDAQQRTSEARAVPGSMALMNGWTFGHAGDIDAAGAALKTGAQNLVGRGPGYGMKDAFNATKAADQQILDSYAKAHPGRSTAANLGGALINPVNIAGGEWVNGARGVGSAALRAAAVGGGTGYVAGGPVGAATGALTGAVVPFAAAGAGKVFAAAGHAVSGAGRMVGVTKPVQVGVQRLRDAMAKDIAAGADPLATLRNWKGNSQPTLADLGGENVRAAIRDAGTQGPARTVLREYRDTVASELQGHAQTLTRRLTPGDARAVPQVAADIESGVARASRPAVAAPHGSGGAALSDALNAAADRAMGRVNAAYDAARAANPEQAHLPATVVPTLAAGVRDAVAGYGAEDIPRVTRNLASMDNWKTATARDLFELRTRLTNLRAGNDPVEAGAAGKAVKALDTHIDGAMDNGLFTGDPSVVGLWKNANNLRRQFGQQFEGNDLIHALTSRGYRGGQMGLEVTPEDASGVIFGRGAGVNAKPNIARDFDRVTALLGDDHPAVNAVRSEAASRLLGADANTPNYGSAYQMFRGNNPSAANALLPDLSADVGDAQAQIAQHLARRQALQGGGRVLSLGPDNYAAATGALGPASREAQVGARGALMDAIGAPTEGAVGALNRIASASNTGGTLASTFGDDAADAYRQGISAEAARDTNADWMAPNLGSKTFTAGQDAGAHGFHPAQMIMGVVKKLSGGAPLNDAERQALVGAGVQDGLTPDVLQQYLTQRAARGMIGSGYAVAPLASLSAQAAQ